MFDDPNDDLLEFKWGGRTLVIVERAVLLSDEPFRTEFIADAPDTVPDEWPEQ
jgi:hypothetical protein